MLLTSLILHGFMSMFSAGGTVGGSFVPAAPGKTLEATIRDALNALRAWHVNPDNVGEIEHKRKALRAGDKIAFIPPHGRGCLIECKENASSSRLDFAEVKPHQERSLYTAAGVGALALVATSFKERGRWRVFLLHYTDFAELKRSSGRASIPLTDLQRPDCLVELKKFRSQTLAKEWDLQSCLEALAGLQAAPLHHQTPTQERRGF